MDIKKIDQFKKLKIGDSIEGWNEEAIEIRLTIKDIRIDFITGEALVEYDYLLSNKRYEVIKRGVEKNSAATFCQMLSELK